MTINHEKRKKRLPVPFVTPYADMVCFSIPPPTRQDGTATFLPTSSRGGVDGCCLVAEISHAGRRECRVWNATSDGYFNARESFAFRGKMRRFWRQRRSAAINLHLPRFFSSFGRQAAPTSSYFCVFVTLSSHSQQMIPAQ